MLDSMDGSDDTTASQPPSMPQHEHSSPLYDLVGLVNHRGGMGGGHYVAYAQNHKTKRWFEFDDSRVSWDGKLDEG